MKLLILYKQNTPDDRAIAYLQRQLTENRIPLTMIDADSRDGAAYTELYDANDRPAVLIVDDQGRLAQKWQGSLPSLSDITGVYGVAP
jgi:hypothetical protein